VPGHKDVVQQGRALSVQRLHLPVDAQPDLAVNGMAALDQQALAVPRLAPLAPRPADGEAEDWLPQAARLVALDAAVVQAARRQDEGVGVEGIGVAQRADLDAGAAPALHNAAHDGVPDLHPRPVTQQPATQAIAQPRPGRAGRQGGNLEDGAAQARLQLA